jgi:hypothetical protein
MFMNVWEVQYRIKGCNKIRTTIIEKPASLQKRDVQRAFINSPFCIKTHKIRTYDCAVGWHYYREFVNCKLIKK